MQIRLQTLEHQQRALTALTHVFADVNLENSSPTASNPVFDVSDPQIASNILDIQEGSVDGIASIPKKWCTHVDNGVLGIDVKMETGTGKTLVYTQLMYELNRLYGFHKFIILVPSTPIKEGTKAFISSDYAKRYFDDVKCWIRRNAPKVERCFRLPLWTLFRHLVLPEGEFPHC